MSSHTLSYLVSDTTNTSVDVEKLESEILSNATVKAALDADPRQLNFSGVSVAGKRDLGTNAITVSFADGDTISSAVETAIDALIAAHTGALNELWYLVDDTSTNTVNVETLAKEIAADSTIAASALNFWGVTLIGSRTDTASLILVQFAVGDLPSAGERSAVAAVVAAHDGALPTSLHCLSTSLIESGEHSVSSDGSYETIGGSVMDMSSWGYDLSVIKVVLTASVKVDDGAESQLPLLRVFETLETDGDGVALQTNSPADTAAGWQTVSYESTTNPRAGLNHYKIQADKNGCTSFDVRYIRLHVMKAS